MMRDKSLRNMEMINEIRYRILDKIDNKYDKSVGSFPWDMVSPVAFELGYLHDRVDDSSLMLSVENLKDEDLDLRVYEITGKKRKPATKASGNVIIKGENGVVVEKGTLVSAGSVDYEVLEGASVDNGSVIVPVECVIEGSIGNVRKGGINTFTAPVGGLTSVYNPEDITNGYDRQTDESLREEYYLHLQLPATSGNVAHYKLWAKEVVGVGEVYVVPLWKGNGTVGIFLTDSNNDIPSGDLVDEVFEYIEMHRPIGATVTVMGAKTKEVEVSASIRIIDGFEKENIKESFHRELEKYQKNFTFEDRYVSFGHVGSILLEDVPGVENYEDLKLNGSYKNIPLEPEEIPTFIVGDIEVLSDD